MLVLMKTSDIAAEKIRNYLKKKKKILALTKIQLWKSKYHWMGLISIGYDRKRIRELEDRSIEIMQSVGHRLLEIFFFNSQSWKPVE